MNNPMNQSGNPTAMKMNTASSVPESMQRRRAPAVPRPAEQSLSRRRREADGIQAHDMLRLRGGMDIPLLVITLILVCFGLVMVFSASYADALNRRGDSYYYIKRQAIFAVLGILIMLVVSTVDYRFFQKLTLPAFLFCTALLIITPIYGIAAGVARRWIVIGSFRFQPSELMKLALVLFLAWYYARYERYVVQTKNFWKSSLYGIFLPICVIGMVCVLIALENHFSCLIIMFLIGMAIVFIAGGRPFWFTVFGLGAAVVVVVAITFSNYASERVDVWLHPENYSSDDETYQTNQALYAVGSGGFLGVGFGQSRQKQMFLSEPMNDFIFAIICEELGMVGAVALIILFLLFIWRGIVIALRAPDTFSSLVAAGITAKVAIQSLLNIGVVTAMLPNTGISLPFISYGGTALMMLLCEVGILLCISRYTTVRPKNVTDLAGQNGEEKRKGIRA